MSTESVLELFKQTKQELVAALRKQHNTLINPMSSTEGDVVAKAVLPYMENGKCIRGGLVLILHNILGGNNKEDAISAALALEYIHTSILTADDMIDDDDTRRGLPSMHRQLEQDFSLHEKQGRDQAICVSLITSYVAFHLLANISPHIQQLITTNLVKTGYGEMQEVNASAGKPITTEDILTIYRHKTGTYTFSIPLAIGAHLTNQTPETITLLENIGEELGIIFQIKDDLLEIEQSSEHIGKSMLSDIKNNVYTYPRALLEAAVTPSESGQIQEIYKNVSEENAKRLFELYDKYHITTTINRDLETRYQQVITQTKKLSDNLQLFIAQLGDYLLHRTK